MKTLLLCLLTVGQSIAQPISLTNFWGFKLDREPAITLTQTCEISNQVYTVRYTYNPNGCAFVPLTNPAGQAHYDCTVSVFLGTRQIGTNFPGQVTQDGCFEDEPCGLVWRALAQAMTGPEPTQWAAMRQAATNVVLSADSITNGWAYEFDDEPIRRLAKAGHICRVFGHWFELDLTHSTYAIWPPRPPQRKCKLCGLTQTKVEEWK